MFFRHLLTTWFLLFTLGSSVTWAFSDHSAAGHDTQISENSDMWSSPFSGNNGCDDHCGHSGAHVMALISSAAALELETNSTVFCICKQIPASREPAPPFQPPIS